MWQPEQPSSQTVATRGLVTAHAPRCGPASSGRNGRLVLVPAATGRPFSKRAPVGQTWTHLPQLVQVGDSPQGMPMSAWIRVSRPRCMTSQVCAPSISSQTRTQRRHRMQRLWSRVNRRCVASTSTLGLIRGRSKWVTCSVVRHVLQLAVVVGHADGTDVVALEEDHLRRRRGGTPGARSSCAVTSMPSVIWVTQAAARRGEPAISTTHRRQAPRSWMPGEVAQARDVDPVLLGDLHDRLAVVAGDVPAVDRERVDGHAITSAGCSISQTPAGHLLSTMWARYSSRK